MKKTAIVSCYFQPNYGSMLQAYATQMILDELGYENETIDITGFNHEIRTAKIRYFVKAAFTSGILFSKIGRFKSYAVCRLTKNRYTENLAVRNRAFKRFEDKYFRKSPQFQSKSELGKNCEKQYSTVLVGSDQLWLPGNIAADYYTLNFVPETVNTIAYATSFGQSVLPADSERLASCFLKRIRHISVREESGQRLVYKLASRKVPIVCDPTLLFTGSDWMGIQEEAPIVDGKYIFVYLLGNNRKHREFVARLKRESNFKVVVLPHIDEYVKEDEGCADQILYDIDPAQFLNLIRNAAYVCTDSFHCTVFSILYHRFFFTFRRYSSKSRQSTNSRIDTLFDITGIKGRLFEGEENIKTCVASDIDFSTVEINLTYMREKSIEYLKHALENEGSTDS